MEIVSALQTIPVKRLKNSWALLPAEILAQFRSLVDLMSPAKNYLSMRNFLNSVINNRTPVLPYIGMGRRREKGGGRGGREREEGGTRGKFSRNSGASWIS
jgi:hypothetical protein